MSHDPHQGFIIAAYALAFVMVAGMIGVIWMDYLRLKRQLSSLAAFKRQQNPDEEGAARLNRQDQESQE